MRRHTLLQNYYSKLPGVTRHHSLTEGIKNINENNLNEILNDIEDPSDGPCYPHGRKSMYIYFLHIFHHTIIYFINRWQIFGTGLYSSRAW